jgi:TonB-dependent starch-binding outer membrane protein SusC
LLTQTNKSMLLTAFIKKTCTSMSHSGTGCRKRSLTILIPACLLFHFSGRTQTITLNLSDAPLETAFKQIQQQTSYRFIYTSEIMQETHKITVNLSQVSLETALKACFNGQPLKYTIDKNFVSVYKKPADATAQIILGRVVNEKGEPLTGATISVKGRSYTVQADQHGDFELHGVRTGITIIVSNVGYEPREMRVGGTGPLTIQLVALAGKLDEVQVIAYGTVTKRLNTGDVGTVNAETIGEQPISNPLEALEGRVAGISIVQNTGVPGGGFSVMIRGQNSLRSDANDPLYLIDGVPYISTSLSGESASGSIIPNASPLNLINPSDIESIEILKDADATAIYGSRGSNGVILITTKKGKAGKTKFDFNVYTGFGKVTHLMNLLNTSQYLQMRYEALGNDSFLPYLVPQYAQYFPDLLLWDTTRYTNWQKVLIGGTSAITSAQGSVSGGNAHTQFLLGGGYYRESTVFPGNFADQKGSVHFNLNHISEDQKFRFTLSVNYLNDNNNLLRQDLTGLAISLQPDAPPIYDSTGNLNWANSSWINPFRELGRKYSSISDNLVSNSVLSYQLLKGLFIKTSLGYSEVHTDETSTLPISANNPAYPSTGTAVFNHNGVKTWIIEPQAEYSAKLGSGKLDALAGTTFQQTLSSGESLEGTGYSSDALLENIQAATSVIVNSANYSEYRYDAVFARLNYNWQDKYLVNLTGRRDGSSRFGPGKQFANFGAAGLGWIFSKENAISHNINFLSFGKLRGSYGITGSDQIPDYGFLNTYSATLPYQGQGAILPSQLYNPDFAWEVNRKIELALELGFLRDRILFSTSIYRNRSSNQLVGYPLPAITGFTSIPYYNLPATVQNTGLEFEINTRNFKAKNFSWSTSLNLTIPANKLLSYPNLAASSYANVYVVGKPLSIVQAFHYTGVDPNTGVYTFLDVNQDGQITYPQDLTSLKKIAQAYYGGLQNGFVFCSFSLDIFLQFVKQTGRNYLYAGFSNSPGSAFNQPTVVMNRWQYPGDKTNIEEFTQNPGSAAGIAYANTSQLGDNTVSDASFIRLKNLSFSWQLPNNWKEKLKIQNCRIYLQGQNLFTKTNYAGMDPENQNAIALPPLKKITAGIQLTL